LKEASGVVRAAPFDACYILNCAREPPLPLVSCLRRGHKETKFYLLVAIPGGGGMAYFSKNLSHKGTALSSRTISFKNRPLLSLLEIPNHFWFEILSLLRSLRKGALPFWDVPPSRVKDILRC